MDTTQESPIAETKLDQIPLGFRLLAKEELQKEITKHNSSLTLDTDTTYINMASGTSTSSETLTEALLKKSIGEINLLNNNLAGLYRNPTDINVKDRIQGLDTANLKNIIDQLSITLVNTYRQQVNNFWKAEGFSIPQELQDDPINDLLKALVENSSLIEKVYQVDNMYPNLKQTVVSYFSKKLKSLYKKDIHPDTVRVLLFNKGQENSHSPFLSFDLTNFTMNYFSAWFFYSYVYLSDKTTIQVKLNQDAQNVPLSNILQTSDVLAIKSKHQARLELFWQKNSDNYRALAKFSYIKALFEQQKSRLKLSRKGLELAFQAMGFSYEAIITLGLDPNVVPPDTLQTLSSPNRVEVSSFLFNNQTSSDILKIRDIQTNDLLLYIPGYTPSFIEAKNESLLIHWVFQQARSPENLSLIASHFPHSSRAVNNIKLDAFLYQDYAKQGNIALTIAQGDIFSFITERQKARVIADLHADGIPVHILSGSFPDYQSTDSALFTTIAEAIKYIPYLLPNIQATSSDLHELFPSPYATASEVMKKGIKEKLKLDIDPDKTFIRFSLHEAKSITYDATIPPASRGQKASITIQSLTEAALRNYREGYSPFGYTTIIYQDPSGKGEYTSSGQLLNISPKDVEEVVKAVDLDALHKSKLDSFWNAHTDRIKYFIKHRFLQQALEKYQNKTLSKEDFQIVSEIAFYSLAIEEEDLPALPNISIEILKVGSYQSTDIFVFRDTSKPKVILYIAGNQRAFFSFANYENCICFLEENARKDTNWQKLLLPHFSIDSQDSVLSSLKLGPYTQSSTLGTSPYPRPVDCSFTNPDTQHPITTKAIEKSLFEVIQKNIQERSYLDANTVITSDRELLLKRIINIAKAIEVALLVPSLAFPVLNWASLAALATETAVNLYIAKNGDTAKERRQAVVDAGINAVEFLLIAAFLHFQSLKFSKNRSSQVSTRAAASGRGLQTFLKKTPVSEEAFFDTTKSMQVWQIATSNSRFSHLDVKAWLLDEQFLLFTGKTSKAKHLIISSHGGYFPGSGIVKVPANSELVVLGPHGWELTDPKTANIAKKLVLPYGIINERAALPTQNAFDPSIFSGTSSNIYIYPKPTNMKILAGTNVPGHIRNYSLSKYQKFGPGEESYLDIVQLINRSRNTLPVMHEIGLKPIDVLTIRNRVGTVSPNLEDLFKSLQSHGIHYDRITLEFCRSNAFLSAIKLAPRYTASTL